MMWAHGAKLQGCWRYYNGLHVIGGGIGAVFYCDDVPAMELNCNTTGKMKKSV